MLSGQARIVEGELPRLTTWKAISEFLGKDERTAKRWERTRGMPVHRVPGGAGTVHAYVDELKRWRDGGSGGAGPRDVAAEAFTNPSTPAISQPEQGSPSRGRVRLSPLVPGGLAAVGVALLAGLWAFQGPKTAAGKVRPNPSASTTPHVPKPGAVDLYRQGRYEWNRRTPDSLHAAFADFTRAAVLDPDYADAFSGLADTYNLMREYGAMPDDQAYPAAAQAAEHALALNSGLAEAHAALAFVKFHWSWDVAGARREFDQAIELDPRSANAQQWYATALLELGAYDDALNHIDRAEALAPESASIRADRGLILLDSGRVQAAEETLRQLELADPTFLSPHYYLSDMYFLQRRYPEYLQELRVIAALKGDLASRRLASVCERAYRTGGEAAMLRAKLETQQALYAEGLLSDYELAYAYAGNHDGDAAMRYLAAAVAHHAPGVLNALGAPEFRFLRGRPDYRQLCVELRTTAAQFSIL